MHHCIAERIAGHPGDWKKVVGHEDFAKRFGSLEGEQLSRAPRSFDPAHPYIDDIRRKSFVAGSESSIKTAQTKALVDDVSDCFKALQPLMKFLCSALGVAY